MYKISQIAEEDIYQIARYTIRQFGVNQAKKYHNELKKTFELLASSPWIGKECHWVCEGMRRFEFKKHSIYYMPQTPFIFISRVIHQSVDVDELDFAE
jgi:toxin ParE1/3/4